MDDDESHHANMIWHAVFDADPDKALAAFVYLLRCDAPIPPEARDRLADLFDKDAASSRYLVELKERRRGRPKTEKTPQQIDEVCDFVNALVRKGEKKEAAIMSAAAHFKISRSSVFAILHEMDDLLAGRKKRPSFRVWLT